MLAGVAREALRELLDGRGDAITRSHEAIRRSVNMPD
jgi:hypothetical protein